MFFRLSLTLTLLILLTLLVLLLIPQLRSAAPTAASSPPLTVEHVQQLGTLVTTRVVVRVDAAEHVEGYLGGLTVTWRGSGSVLIGPDLSRAGVIEQDDARRVATVVMPPPAVLERTLDLSSGRTDTAWKGLWQFAPDGRLLSDAHARLLAGAQRRLGDAVTADHHDAAVRSTESAVDRLGRSLGWTLKVRWPPPPGRRGR